MDTASTIREFLDENRIAAVRSVEIAYKYHAELEPGCRIAGCEMIMRSVGDDVFVRAELPISVMTKETRGVVKFLADLNKKRVEEGKLGYFDLDYVAGKIIFSIRVRQPITTELLKDVAGYCVDQIEYESDDLIKVVCDECEAVLQAEEEKRLQEEKENREPGMLGMLLRRLRNIIMNKNRPSGRTYRPYGLPGSDDDSYEDDYGYGYDYDGDDDKKDEKSGPFRTGFTPRYARKPSDGAGSGSGEEDDSFPPGYRPFTAADIEPDEEDEAPDQTAGEPDGDEPFAEEEEKTGDEPFPPENEDGDEDLEELLKILRTDRESAFEAAEEETPEEELPDEDTPAEEEEAAPQPVPVKNENVICLGPVEEEPSASDGKNS